MIEVVEDEEHVIKDHRTYIELKEELSMLDFRRFLRAFFKLHSRKEKKKNSEISLTWCLQLEYASLFDLLTIN